MIAEYYPETGVLAIFDKPKPDCKWMIRQEDKRPDCWDLFWLDSRGRFDLLASCVSFGAAYSRAQELA